MKKVKLTAILLCLVILSTFCVGIVDKIILFANEIDLSKNYWESNCDLHNLSINNRETYENSLKNLDPYITVFTHGCGGDKSHWSSDSNFNFEK